jgi:hypothetical protein
MMTNGLKGAQHWTAKNTIKIRNLSRVLLEIGSADNTNSPLLYLFRNWESRGTWGFDQTTQTHSKDYGIIHFDSPDKEELMSFATQIFPSTTYTNIPLYVYKRDKLKHRL